ncbi:MAG TPA: hypothetical protein VI547_00170 [Anaerolineales bacterium]|nr:hypothetical protein [Anaerolineales bacterium]
METEESKELRKVVREVVTEVIAPLPTRDEIKTLATRDEMSAAFDRARVETEAAFGRARAETDSAFDRQAELIQKEFQRINQRLTALEARVAKLEEKFDGLAERVNKRLEKTSDDIAELTVTTKKHRADQLTMQERLDDLEARIAQLEAARHG